MCVNKLYIRTNKLQFDPLVDRMFNYVPCGYCAECTAQKQQAYVLRQIFEYKRSACAFYYTLTYDNENLPHYSGIPCFNLNHITNFLKRLRSYLNQNIRLKYFYSTEYGDERKRPHIHFTFFLSDKIHTSSFRKMVQKAWFYGSVYSGLNNGLIVDIRPFTYCAKYVTKDSNCLDYLNKTFDSDLIQDFVLNGNKEGYEFLPFHNQSLGLGDNLKDYITDRDLIRGYITFSDKISLVDKYPIPLYIYRKLLYDTYKNSNGNVSYKLNKRGLNLLPFRLSHQRNELLEQYAFIIHNIGSLTDKYFDNFKHKFEDLGFNRDDIKIFVSNFPPRFLPDFVDWLLLYRDNHYIPFKFNSFFDDCKIFVEALRNGVKEEGYYFVSRCEEDFNLLLQILTLFQPCLKYDFFIRRQSNFNCKQNHLRYKSGKYKPVKLTPYNEFINPNFCSPCLNTFRELKKLIG